MYPQKLNWTVKRVADGWLGTISIPLGESGTPIAVSAKAADRGSAARRVSDLASRLATNPAVAAMLPPGAPQVLATLGAVARNKTTGQVITIGSKAIKKLASWF